MPPAMAQIMAKNPAATDLLALFGLNGVMVLFPPALLLGVAAPDATGELPEPSAGAASDEPALELTGDEPSAGDESPAGDEPNEPTGDDSP